MVCVGGCVVNSHDVWVQECASLADRLIQGQVTLAQDAEEKFVLLKQVSVFQRTVSRLEQEKNEILTSEGKRAADGRSPDSLSFGGVESPPQSPSSLIEVQTESCPAEGERPLPSMAEAEPSSTLRDKAKSHKSKIKKRFSTKLSNFDSKHKDKNRNKSYEIDPRPPDGQLLQHAETRDDPSPERSVTPSQSPTPQRSHKRKKSKSLSVDITNELAKVKLQCAETAHQLECKSLELTKALQREAFLLREMEAAKEHIMELELTVREAYIYRQPHLSSTDFLHPHSLHTPTLTTHYKSSLHTPTV